MSRREAAYGMPDGDAVRRFRGKAGMFAASRQQEPRTGCWRRPGLAAAGQRFEPMDHGDHGIGHTPFIVAAPPPSRLSTPAVQIRSTAAGC
jgi:hypothetical protein